MRWLPLIFFVSCAAPIVPTFASIDPMVVDAQSGGAVTLHGTQWLPPTKFDFDKPEASTVGAAQVSAFLIIDGGSRVELTGLQWVDATQITGQVPPLPVGVYDVHLIEPRGAELVLPAALNAEDCFGGQCGDAGPCAQSNYRDFDLDGYGSGGAVNRCGAGYVPLSGDCDSFDDLIHPGAPEICNGLDDNCDGVIDNGACTGWAGVGTDAGVDFLFASSPAKDQVWVADATRVFNGGDSFTEFSAGCVSGITAIGSQTGSALELSALDALQRIEPPAACAFTRGVDGGVVSIVNFGALFVGVTSKGDIWRWNAGGAPVITPTNLPADVDIIAAHGVSTDHLIAVGTVAAAPRAWTLGADGGWSAEPNLPRNGGAITSVWMLSPTDAVIAGLDGTLVLHYSGGWFNARTGSVRDDFTSVRAFSLSRIYVTTASGLVRQRSGVDWRTVFTGTQPLHAITGVSEDGLWAAGNGGTVVRGSR